VKKEYKLIPKGRYTTLWAILGIIVFGLPLGIICGKITDNMGIIPNYIYNAVWIN
jgi:hypothetical protein